MTNNAHEDDIAGCYGITEASEEISISEGLEILPKNSQRLVDGF